MAQVNNIISILFVCEGKNLCLASLAVSPNILSEDQLNSQGQQKSQTT
jgi:hypothetical protein